MPVDVAELMQAANAPAKQDENFYGQRNDAFAQIAVEANQNTPESQIAAQKQQLEVVQQRNNIALDVIMQAHAKDQQLYDKYQTEYVPRKQDYDMLQQERLGNLHQITEIEQDPEQNSLLHPVKTIMGWFKQSRARDQNDAIVEEMNAINNSMGSATEQYIAAHQHNKEELAFNLQTELELKTANSMAAATQAEQAAQLRYTDKESDINRLITATSGIAGASLESLMAARREANTEPTKEELAFWKANKTGTPLQSVVSDAEYPILLRGYKSEPEDVRASNAVALVEYKDHQQRGLGSTEIPTSFVQRKISTTNDSDYARGLDKLTGGRFSEVANIGLELQVQEVAASIRAGKLSGLSKDQLANAMLMKQLGETKDIADQTAQQLAVKNALAGSFKESLGRGIEYVRGDMATAVTDTNAINGTRYTNPAKVSGLLSSGRDLLAQIPQQYLNDKDPTQLSAEADVVAKVSGMRGGDLQSHKFLEANDFLKRQGITDESQRVGILRNWLQFGLRGSYQQQGVHRNLLQTVKDGVTDKAEEFTVPVETAPIKASNGVFGRSIPALPAFDLSSTSGMALYLRAIESGAVKQAKDAEALKTNMEGVRDRPFLYN